MKNTEHFQLTFILHIMRVPSVCSTYLLQKKKNQKLLKLKLPTDESDNNQTFVG